MEPLSAVAARGHYGEVGSLYTIRKLLILYNFRIP